MKKLVLLVALIPQLFVAMLPIMVIRINVAAKTLPGDVRVKIRVVPVPIVRNVSIAMAGVAVVPVRKGQPKLL